jgi:hypothetical protein
MKITWTDTPKGRQFWIWCTVDEEWVKDSFFTWDQLKVLTKTKSVVP